MKIKIDVPWAEENDVLDAIKNINKLPLTIHYNGIPHEVIPDYFCELVKEKTEKKD